MNEKRLAYQLNDMPISFSINSDYVRKISYYNLIFWIITVWIFQQQP